MSEIPKAPIARIIKESGAERVSEDAKDELAAYLEEVARNVAKEANSVAKIAKRKTVKAEDLIEIIENSMSSQVCELLKRPDENATVINAHKKPVFVEDCVRNMMEKIVKKYDDFPDDTLITARQENQESIHRHNAFAEKITTLGELKEELNI